MPKIELEMNENSIKRAKKVFAFVHNTATQDAANPKKPKGTREAALHVSTLSFEQFIVDCAYMGITRAFNAVISRLDAEERSQILHEIMEGEYEKDSTNTKPVTETIQ